MLGLFIGLELRIPAIESLLPGSYGGLTTANYLGFAFLVGGVTSLGSAFRSVPSPQAPPTAGSPPTSPGTDPYSMATAMMALHQGSVVRPVSGAVACLSCGAINSSGSRFCQSCGKTLPSPASTSTPAQGRPPTVACPACGAPNLLGPKFCQACGAAFKGPE